MYTNKCLFLRFQLDNEEYVEFSKMTDERIIGTKGETATIFDTRTGRELMTLTPAISNQYAKNRATFNPTDELVLSGEFYHPIAQTRKLSRKYSC